MFNLRSLMPEHRPKDLQVYNILLLVVEIRVQQHRDNPAISTQHL